MRHASTHGPGATEYFRHENEILPEFYTDDTHAADQAIIHNLDGIDTFRKSRLRQFIRATIVALDYRRRDLLQARFSLAKKLYKRVFQPGFTTKERGWGLGLSLCKRIIENYHEGKVFVKSSEAGKGTTFRIVLQK